MCIVSTENCWICAVQSRSKGEWFLKDFWKGLMKGKTVVSWVQLKELRLWGRRISTKDICEQWQQREEVCEWHTIFSGHGSKYFCLQRPHIKEIRCSLDNSEGLSIARATGYEQLRHLTTFTNRTWYVQMTTFSVKRYF